MRALPAVYRPLLNPCRPSKPIRPVGPEHKHCPRARILMELILYQRCQPVLPLAEVDRLNRHHDPHPTSRRIYRSPVRLWSGWEDHRPPATPQPFRQFERAVSPHPSTPRCAHGVLPITLPLKTIGTTNRRSHHRAGGGGGASLRTTQIRRPLAAVSAKPDRWPTVSANLPPS